MWCACSNEEALIESHQTKKTVLLSVDQASSVDTKTYIDDGDPNTMRWSPNDVITLWATSNGGSTYAIDASEFSLHYYTPDFNKAVFIGSVNNQGAQVNYTYFGVYPKPKNVSGSNVVMMIPPVQTGVYDGSADIMAANPVVGLKLSDEGENEVDLVFRHLTHAIRFQVPSQDRYPMDHKITQIKINFPQDVAGQLSFNAATSNVTPTFSNGAKEIILNLPRPLAAGDYFWAFIKPGTINGEIQIHPYSDIDGDGNSYIGKTLVANINKTMSAGHITPITLTIDEAPRTIVNLKIKSNNLGEPLTKMVFTAPENCRFRDGSTTHIHNFTNQENVITLEYYSNHYSANFQKDGLTVTYESANALLENKKISLSSVVKNRANDVDINVPYLFEENFSSVTTFDKNTKHTTGDAGHGKTIDLKDKGLPGWTADRAGGEAGKSIRTCARLEGGLWAQKIYRGRIDSPPMSGIKPGKAVKLRISYKYSGGRFQGAGKKIGTPKYNHGLTDNPGILSGIDGIEWTVGSDMQQGISGSYSSVTNHRSFDRTGCEDNYRISWRASVSRAIEIAQNGNYWLYIDDVKVQIVK